MTVDGSGAATLATVFHSLNSSVPVSSSGPAILKMVALPSALTRSSPFSLPVLSVME
jgi:hypothetical protein